MSPTPNLRVTLSFIIFVLTVLLSLHLAEVDARKLCGPNHFRCKNGRRCVAAIHVCDGEAHCKDALDENTSFCAGNYTGLTKSITNCKPGMYRCRFGGCINATKICDGHPDCFDASDETRDLCRHNRCGSKYFRCDYGACVKNRAACNGRTDCLDSSDETKDICQDKVCPSNFFKCKYGACIPKDKMCDKKHHCVDRSDESDEVCNKPGGKVVKTKKYPSKASKSTTPKSI